MITVRIGRCHPDPVVESSSLSSVMPPPVWFDLKLPSDVVDECKLSSLQLEAIVYACQQHMNILTDGSRAGHLIGKDLQCLMCCLLVICQPTGYHYSNCVIVWLCYLMLLVDMVTN